MDAMIRLAMIPAHESARVLKATQHTEARAAKMNPSLWWVPRRCIERNMKTAAAQSSP